MSLISFFLVTYSLSSVFSFNSYDNKEVPKYRQVLSVHTPKYKTLEITATPTNKYYFVPTFNERATYKKLTVTPTIKSISNHPTISIVPPRRSHGFTSVQPATIRGVTISPTAQEEGFYLSREDFILNEINNYRASKGLSRSEPDSNTCGFAKLRAAEISINFNHDGFTNRINDKTLPYSSYSQVTENISMNSDYKQVAVKWIESSGHAANIEKDTPFICVGSSGDYYTMQGWKP